MRMRLPRGLTRHGPIMKTLARRYAILSALFKRAFALREGLILILPSGCVVQVARFMRPASITLFGRDFFVADDYHEALDLIDTIIATDQYCAKRFLKVDSVIIDAGANIGAFSVFASTLAPRGSIYAFEPGPRAFALLKQNTATYGNIRCYNCGLGNISKRHKLLLHSQHTVTSSYEDSGCASTLRSQATVVDSQVMTIDEFILREQIVNVDFIKIDTEGYEAKIIEGARETIKKYRPIIVTAAYHHSDDAETLPSLVKTIAENYQFSVEDRGEVDLICAPR
jgi:FkbM family methyltransferase